MDNDEVGYKKPPKPTRFKAGQSGNPKGRPRGARNFSKLVLEEAAKQVSITENGQTVTLSKIEVAAKRLVNKAMAGDWKSINLLANITKEEKGEINQQMPTVLIIDDIK